jgi:hypothetical protein
MSKYEAQWIIARSECCKKVIFAAINETRVMDSEMHLLIGKLVKNGASIHNVDLEELKQCELGCHCLT